MGWLGHQLIFHVETLEKEEGSNMTVFISRLCVIQIFSLRQSQLETMTLRFLEKGQWRTQRKGKPEVNIQPKTLLLSKRLNKQCG